MKIVAIEAHQLNSIEDINVDFFDNNKTPIFSGDLFEIIGQKVACGCFYVELRISGEENRSITVAVSSKFLEKSSQNYFTFIVTTFSNYVIIWK